MSLEIKPGVTVFIMVRKGHRLPFYEYRLLVNLSNPTERESAVKKMRLEGIAGTILHVSALSVVIQPDNNRYQVRHLYDSFARQDADADEISIPRNIPWEDIEGILPYELKTDREWGLGDMPDQYNRHLFRD